MWAKARIRPTPATHAERALRSGVRLSLSPRVAPPSTAASARRQYVSSRVCWRTTSSLRQSVEAYMQRSTERILTTHVGSLARPHPLLKLMQAQVAGEPYDKQAFASLSKQAVSDVVREQSECGIDIVSDGEQSKAGFFAYVAERLTGLEASSTGVPDRAVWKEELEQFAEYYQQYLGGKAETMVRNPPLVCTGPITYKGQKALRADIDNLRAAIATQ